MDSTYTNKPATLILIFSYKNETIKMFLSDITLYWHTTLLTYHPIHERVVKRSVSMTHGSYLELICANENNSIANSSVLFTADDFDILDWIY